MASSPVDTVMSNAQYRAASEPANPDLIMAARRREVGSLLLEIGREFFEKHGGKEIDAAIALLSEFVLNGREYVNKLLRDQARELDEAHKRAALPEESKLPEGQARQLVKQARKAKPVIDASSATRLCKLLIDLVQLREATTTKTSEAVNTLFMEITDGKGLETTLPTEAIGRLMRQATQLA